MPQITGLHHLALPTTDPVRSAEWYERVFGFSRILVEEEEDRVTAVVLEHLSGVLLVLHQADGPLRGWPDLAVFALTVTAGELGEWVRHLSALGVQHSPPREAHLGSALDVTGPDGFRIQLHTRENLSADDA
jgi:catechol 2,3-dioxygenase-like lactoylglutathione lyase family enzyme